MESAIKDGQGIESKVTIKRVENEDGSSEEIRVEEVEGGFIKTIEKRFKDSSGEWQWKIDKSVSIENPLEEKSIADKLEEFIKNK